MVFSQWFRDIGLVYIPSINCTEFYAAELADDATKNFFEYALDDYFG